MSISDPISDMLARLKNAQRSFLISVDVPYSSQKLEILKVLKEEGYIASYVVEELRKGVKNILVGLKYSKAGKPAIETLERVSRPGRRFYSAFVDLKDFFNGMGIYILSTSSHGIVSDRVAKRAKIGGEIICRVF
jgi:small subunit ribosomal protein S8